MQINANEHLRVEGGYSLGSAGPRAVAAICRSSRSKVKKGVWAKYTKCL